MNFEAPKTKISFLLVISGFLLTLLCLFWFTLTIHLLGIENVFEFSHIGMLLCELFLPFPLIIWASTKKIKYKDIFRFNKIKLPYLVFSILVAIGLIIILDEIERVLTMFIEYPDYIKQINEFMKFKGLQTTICLIVGVAIIAPVTEEMVFRGFFQQTLEHNFRSISNAFLIVALAFMIIHLNLYFALHIFIIGYFLSFVAWKTNSIWPSIIIHSVNNFLSLLFTNFEDIIEKTYIFHGHVHPVIFFIALFFFAYFLFKLTKLKNCTIWKGKTYEG